MKSTRFLLVLICAISCLNPPKGKTKATKNKRGLASLCRNLDVKNIGRYGWGSQAIGSSTVAGSAASSPFSTSSFTRNTKTI